MAAEDIKSMEGNPMSGKLTIQYLQEYIKAKDYNPELKKDYFLKLSEEVGELSRAIRKDLRPVCEADVKETIEEELWDVIYYALALANCYDINLEDIIPLKEAINNEKYNSGVEFNPL